MFSCYINLQSAMIKWLSRSILMAVIGIPMPVIAQASTQDANELSKQLVNPIGPNWVLNTFLNVTEKTGDIANESRTGTEWLIQPVMPIPLDNKPMGLTLMNRPTLPIVFKSPVPQTDATGDFAGFDNASGIGDLMIQTAIGSMPRTNFGMFMWGVGVALMFPTASNDDVGSGKYSAGPSGMLVGFTENYTFGVVVNQIWSYAGDDSRNDVNQSQFQLLYFKQLGNGWQIGDNPQWSIKWDNGSREKYDVPIGLGVFKTTYIGNMGWRFGVTPRFFLRSFENWGNKWSISFTITPVIRNPFMSPSAPH